MLGLMAISDFSQLFATTYTFTKIAPKAAIPCIISLPLMFAAVCVFLRYFCLDNYDTRSRLVTGSLFMVIANFITFVGLTLAIIFSKDIPGRMFWGLIPTYVFPMVLWVYYREICKQWVTLGETVAEAELRQRESANRQANSRSENYLQRNP